MAWRIQDNPTQAASPLPAGFDTFSSFVSDNEFRLSIVFSSTCELHVDAVAYSTNPSSIFSSLRFSSKFLSEQNVQLIFW